MRLSPIIAFALLWGLGACDGGDSKISFVDDAALFDGDAGRVCSSCSPVTQACCDPGQKCAHLVESADPFLARRACVPDGLAVEDKACSRGPAGPATGYDNCAAGLHCLAGICSRICDAYGGESCHEGTDAEPVTRFCTSIEGVFDDFVGVCADHDRP